MFKTSTGLTGTVTVMDAVITVERCLRSCGDVVAVEDVSHSDRVQPSDHRLAAYRGTVLEHRIRHHGWTVAWCGEVECRPTAENATLGDAR